MEKRFVLRFAKMSWLFGCPSYSGHRGGLEENVSATSVLRSFRSISSDDVESSKDLIIERSLIDDIWPLFSSSSWSNI